ncbi:hypothetical protein [Flavihumibacter petaseus]|uniref:Uncharacterized protein n=1 Tax=Flavihumibacter petaseus NBRC 106054 TaxID=1220578 RepID=A0A0E9N6S9_9BACT|nr:hypothetical protein [Flavihumibacter petaseus]GAO45401.1 hypothetical protein FPE01S_05_00960 [Flavihumibacter petaseus NBRC 106054]
MEVFNTINNNIKTYYDLIVEDLRSNAIVRDLINKVYFSTQNNIVTVLENCVVFGFTEYSHKQGNKLLMCSPRDLDSVKPLEPPNRRLGLYEIFDLRRFATFEEAIVKVPATSFWVRSDFNDLIDRFLFENLTDFEKIDETSYQKQLNDNLSIILDCSVGREQKNFLYEYKFPTIALKYKDQIPIYHPGDPKFFLFLGDLSFLSFLIWKMDLEKANIENGIAYKAEINSEQSGNGYVVANNPIDVRSFNSYIEFCTGIFLKYFRIYEKYLLAIF